MEVPFEDRVEMIKILLEGESVKSLSISFIEKELPTPSYTYRTLEALEKKFPKCPKWGIVIGEDNLQKLSSWYRFSMWKDRYLFLVLRREGSIPFSPSFLKKEQVYFLENPIWKVSSQEIREKIQRYYQGEKHLEKEILSYLGENLWKYILEKRLYFPLGKVK